MARADIIASTIAVAREKRITVDAASLAFYAFNCLVALAVLIYSVFSLTGTGSTLATTLETLTGVGAAEFQQFFDRLGTNTASRRRTIGLGVVITVWSSLQLFREMESVFAEVYEIREDRSVRRHLVHSVLVLATVTVTVVVMVSIGSLFLFRATGWQGVVLGPFALWLSLVVLFFPMYYTFSGNDTSVREVLPGAAFAAAGWAVSAVGLRIYADVAESVDVYGSVGAVLLVLSWLYVVGLSMVLGVVLNALLAGRIEADRDWFLLGR